MSIRHTSTETNTFTGLDYSIQSNTPDSISKQTRYLQSISSQINTSDYSTNPDCFLVRIFNKTFDTIIFGEIPKSCFFQKMKIVNLKTVELRSVDLDHLDLGLDLALTKLEIAPPPSFLERLSNCFSSCFRRNVED